jgi:O-antigen/teichoic acid export membrane protein
LKKSFWVGLTVGFLAMVPLAYAQFSSGGFEDGTFHGWMGNGGYGKAFGVDGRPENTGIGFFAACLALYLASFLLPVWLLKRHYRPRQGAERTIRFLPLAASFPLAASGKTIGQGKSILERERAEGIISRPFSFP